MTTTTVHPVGFYVGQRLRAIRKDKGLSQEMLAKNLGITFQQVQKYEHGTNRISASRLHEAAAFLGVPVSSLFPPTDAKDVAAEIVLDPKERDFVLRLRRLRTDQSKTLSNVLDAMVEPSSVEQAA